MAKHQDFRSVSINGIDYWVAYVPDPSGPFSALSPFELVTNAYGERFMPREGILVARSKDGKGWFVLAALDKFVERRHGPSVTWRCSLSGGSYVLSLKYLAQLLVRCQTYGVSIMTGSVVTGSNGCDRFRVGVANPAAAPPSNPH